MQVDRFRPDGLAQFDAVATSTVSSGVVPGLVALIARGDEAHVAVGGSLSLGGSPIERDSLFRISSMSKPVTAAATLVLVGEGLLKLDEPVDRLLPELANRQVLRHLDASLDDTVPAERAITVRDLLTFTFGFGMTVEMFMTPEPWPVMTAEAKLHLGTFGAPNPAEQPDPDRWIAGLGTLPLMAQPGERWFYQTGASVVGVLLARAAGQPFEEVLRTRLFEPLGMANTSMWTSETGRLATAYSPTPNGLVVWDAPDGGWSAPPAFGDGAGGLVSTADDMLAFSRMLLRGGAPALSPAAVGEMTRDQLTPPQRASGRGFLSEDDSWGFCQAVIISGPRAGAFGWAGGLGTTWLVDPARDLTVIVMTQRMMDGAQGPSLHDDLQAAAYAAVAAE